MTKEEKPEKQDNKKKPKIKKEEISLGGFKIKKGIPEHIYKGFRINLKAQDNTKYALADLEKKYEEFMKKKI